MTALQRLKTDLALAWRVCRLPRVHLHLWGEGTPRDLYRYFTQPHPKLKVFGLKQIGVSLLPMPDAFGDYLQGGDRQFLRRMRNRAIREGYACGPFIAAEHWDEIMDIHLSKPMRQGEPMTELYADPVRVRAYFQGRPPGLGVYDRQGTLRGYLESDLAGEVWCLRRILGHGDHLGHGIMYLLVSHLVEAMCAHRQAHGYPDWGSYDTYFGGQDGLRVFKDRLGFSPYNVRWYWTPGRGPASPAGTGGEP